jgi:hypothetical protein
VREIGLGTALQPLGAVDVSATVPLYPSSDVTVTVEFLEAPALIVNVGGNDEIEKKGMVIGA